MFLVSLYSPLGFCTVFDTEGKWFARLLAKVKRISRQNPLQSLNLRNSIDETSKLVPRIKISFLRED